MISYRWNVIFLELKATTGSFTPWFTSREHGVTGHKLVCAHHICALTHTLLCFINIWFKNKQFESYLWFFWGGSALVSTGHLIPDVCTQCNYYMWYSGPLSATNAGISSNGILLSAEPQRRSLHVSFVPLRSYIKIEWYGHRLMAHYLPSDPSSWGLLGLLCK